MRQRPENAASGAQHDSSDEEIVLATASDYRTSTLPRTVHDSYEQGVDGEFFFRWNIAQRGPINLCGGVTSAVHPFASVIAKSHGL
jgi:hypothetical protein